MSAAAPREISRVLRRRDVVALAFGAMIGWGCVVLSGEMIRRAGTLGSALAFGWAVLGFVFFSGARRRVLGLGAEGQATAILGEDVSAELRSGLTSRS